MSDRTPVKLALIGLLVLIAGWVNFDFVVKGYEYPERAKLLLGWQGEEAVRDFRLREGLDLQGGLQVLLQASSDEPFTRTDLESAATIIQNRVDSLGVTEAIVQIQGEDKIVVELPGVEDPDLAVRTIGSTAMLEFIYGGNPADPDQVGGIPQEGTTIETTFPVLWSDLPEDKREPREMEIADLEALRMSAGSLETGADSETDSGPATEPSAAGTGASDSAATETDTGAEGATTPSGGSATPEEEATGQTATSEQVTDQTATSEPDATAAAAAGDAPDSADEPVRVFPTVLSGEHVQNAVPQLDLGKWSVSFTLDAEGGTMLQQFTRDHLDQAMPIVLDGKVVSAPMVRATIASSGQITGDFTQPEAQALAVQLKSGALPITLNVVGQSRIGPTLGRESVDTAVLGGVVGMAAVILFMISYYRVPGVLASMALLIYVLLSLTIFRLMPVTLTLAGIAGFVLSIGMAVDANVLIFERMKEELRAGRRMTPAMRTGFERAWPSIRDSNLSTLITCVILFWFGSQFGASIVKGFAVTLAVGVLTSVFTAITVTRTFLEAANKYLLRGVMSTQPSESPRVRTLFGF